MKDYISHYNKKAKCKFPKNIKICDTTLRDGEQTPGVSLSEFEKLDIAIMLDKLKIPQIEAGFPLVSEKEKNSIKKIVNENLNSKIITLSRAKKEDIDASLDCGVDGTIIFIGTSEINLKNKRLTQKEALMKSMDVIDYAKDHGLYVGFSAEDATRTELNFLKEIYKEAQNRKVDRVHIADTVGVITPQGMEYLVKELRKEIRVDINLHCHNDFGMAQQNAIAGLLAGANIVETTINGIGERAGNTPLEELIMSLKILYGIDLGFNTEIIKEISETVELYTKVNIPDNKPIVGKNIFKHESGIHVDGVIKNPFTYEPFSPSIVGQERNLVLGKHSGSKAIKSKLNQFGIKMKENKIPEILKIVKETSENGNIINDNIFKEIVEKV
ncbi:2-isopropylmalate synthase [bioreactor metagenome]|mgnify:CR=1 FL=1|uniref:2-isopropylmalate synthase n=1 Tax=bioreactor metagenome TaxID=1076179 RepID=A0A644T4R2_9ZZZZ|nr:homocitrate synthase family protein [Methanobrevibacter sp.]MEA4956960.1 homocitrate synthase family protein [Methanobrevibacter sp.]